MVRDIRNDASKIYIPTAAEIAASESQPTEVIARESYASGSWAGFWRRFAAQFVDGIILYVPAAILLVIAGTVATVLKPSAGVVLTITYGGYLAVYVLYHGILNSSDGMSTWGRRVAGVVVVAADSGERIGFGRACLRAILSFLSAFLVLPNLVQLFTARRQSVADLLAGTAVVRKGQAGNTGVIVALVVVFLAVPLIGILAAIAVPAYQDYTIRAKVTEGLVQAERAKATVERNFAFSGDPSSAALSQGYAFAPTKFVKAIAIGDGGSIAVTYDTTPGLSQLDGQNVLTLQANIQGRPLTQGATGSIDWACASQSSNVATARGLTTAAGASLPPKYAPANCR